jgi:lysyl-tRNA synthetase class 2
VLTTIATVRSEFDREIVDTGQLAAFFFFIALLGTYGFIRTSTHMIKAQVSWWPGNVSVGGTHVHHLVWGIFAMLIFGYIGVVHQPPSPFREIVSVFFGIGAGLTLDEFALWLELKDVYWEKDGRKSVDAMIISVETGVFAGIGAVGLVAIVVGLVNASKDKYWMAGVSLLFWPAGLVTAVRLAKPHSLWARVAYKDRWCFPRGDSKLERSRARYAEAETSAVPPPADTPAASG